MSYDRTTSPTAIGTLSQFGGMKADSTAGFESVVNLQQRFILTAFLAQFLMLGASGSGGSYSLGQTHADGHSKPLRTCWRACATT